VVTAAVHARGDAPAQGALLCRAIFAIQTADKSKKRPSDSKRRACLNRGAGALYIAIEVAGQKDRIIPGGIAQQCYVLGFEHIDKRTDNTLVTEHDRHSFPLI